MVAKVRTGKHRFAPAEILIKCSSDHQIHVPKCLRFSMLTFATKMLSTVANGQKEDAVSFFCDAFLIKI